MTLSFPNIFLAWTNSNTNANQRLSNVYNKAIRSRDDVQLGGCPQFGHWPKVARREKKNHPRIAGGRFQKYGKTPKSSHFYRGFHYFHHPFWGAPIFGNIQVPKMEGFQITSFFRYFGGGGGGGFSRKHKPYPYS